MKTHDKKNILYFYNRSEGELHVVLPLIKSIKDDIENVANILGNIHQPSIPLILDEIAAWLSIQDQKTSIVKLPKAINSVKDYLCLFKKKIKIIAIEI